MEKQALSLDLMWKEIKQRIESIDFEKLWTGFSEYPFAVYNQEQVCLDGALIPKTNEFLANCAINYQGKWIAIFMVDGTEDLDMMTSKMVHEMFHAFQMENQDERFPNEIQALFEYEYSLENLSGKYRENQLLHKLVETQDKAIWQELLQAKKRRQEKYPQSYNYEAKVEQIEGSANYIELKCLELLNSKLYEEKLAQMKSSLLNAEGLLPIRIGLYDSGALLLKVMQALNVEPDMSFSKTPFAISMLEGVEVSKETTASSEEQSREVELALANYRKVQDEKIEVLSKHKPVLEGKYKILGVNVYNAWYYKNHLYTTYFLAYEDEGEQRILHGNYLLEISNGKMSKVFAEKQ